MALILAGPLVPTARGAAPEQEPKAEKDDQAARRRLLRFFPIYDLDRCRLLRLHNRRVLEFCAVSAPAVASADNRPWAPRRFLLNFRDPSKMDKRKMEALLVTSQALRADKDEYLDYEKVSLHELSGDSYLIFAPIVRGVPDDYQQARAALYIFNEQDLRIMPVWESPACSASPCEQQVRVVAQAPVDASDPAEASGQPETLRGAAPPQRSVTVELVQSAGGKRQGKRTTFQISLPRAGG